MFCRRNYSTWFVLNPYPRPRSNVGSHHGKEDGGTTDDETDAVKCHLVGKSILKMACQNNVTIMCYVEESKDDANWPNG